MIKITIFNEYKHEQCKKEAIDVYPEGIHNTLKGFLESDEISVNKKREILCGERGFWMELLQRAWK